MSTSRGNSSRSRPQKHQNKTAFKNDLHDTSKKTKTINSLEVTGVCQRCKDVIEWKIKYKKYKPLTAPAKCVGCSQKAVKYAYHILCTKCACEKKVCAKCCKPVNNGEEDTGKEETIPSSEIKLLLKDLPERKRRTILRYINKHGEDKITPEIKTYIEELISNVDTLSLGDDFDFSDDEIDSNEEK